MNRLLLAAVLVLLVILVALVGFRKWSRTKVPPSKPSHLIVGDFELTPESESLARAAGVLPLIGSEDVRYLLVPPPVEGPKRTGQPDDRDYTPDPRVDWTIWVELPPGTLLDADQVHALVGRDWLTAHGGAMIYGFCPDTGHWTFVFAADAPEPFSRLGIAKPLARDEPLQAEALEVMLRSAGKLFALYPGTKVTSDSDPAPAAARSRELVQLRMRYDKLTSIVLVAPQGARFDGRKVWDVMYSLGLKWGDMDLFHWVNESSEGDDYYFSVETSTPPGYFIPEAIAANQVQVDDLIFTFSVPRTRAPAHVLEQMAVAARYASSRLGGQLVDGESRPFDLTRSRERVKAIELALQKAGFAAGMDHTLRLF